MPRTSTRIRRLGEPVLVLMDTDDDWQAGAAVEYVAQGDGRSAGAAGGTRQAEAVQESIGRAGPGEAGLG
ncbi:MAG: hypothetical protein ACK6EB_42325, partial [Planctomyces sp.]